MQTEKLEKILIGMMALAMICLRPTVIGEVYSVLSCAVLAASATGLFVLALSTRRTLVPEKFAALQLCVVLFIAEYLLLRTSLYMPSVDPSAEIKAFMIYTSFLLSLLLIVSNPFYSQKFFDYFASLVIASSVSLVITAVLFFLGFQPHQLIIAKINYTYANMGDIAFPFTFIFNEVVSGVTGSSVPRMSGIFREPGIFPFYGCWAAAYAFRRGWPMIVWLICIVATIACLSSIGPPLALYTAGIIFLMRMGIKPLNALLIIAVGGLLTWQIIYTSTYFDLQSKINSGSGSYEERLYLAEAAFDARDVIFGDGLGFSIFTTGPISLVAAVRVFGLVYFAAFVLTYALAAVDLKLWVAGLLPAIFGVMLTQPVFREPGFMIIMFSGIVFVPLKKRIFRLKRGESSPMAPSRRPQNAMGHTQELRT